MDTLNGGKPPQLGTTKLLFLEPAREYKSFVSELTGGSLLDHLIFLPSPAHIKLMLDEARKSGHNIESRIIPYNTINISYDNDMYDASYNMAKIVGDIIQSISSKFFDDRQHLLQDHQKTTFSVALHDRIVTQVRPFFEFWFSASSFENLEVTYAPRPHSGWRFTYDIIASSDRVGTVKLWTAHWTDAQVRMFANSTPPAKSFVPQTIVQIPAFPPQRPQKVSFIFIVNQADKQYRFSALPIYSKLLKKGNIKVLCINPYELTQSTAKQFDIDTALNNGKISFEDKPSTAARRPLTQKEIQFTLPLMRRISKALYAKGGVYQELHAIVTVFAASNAISICECIKETENNIRPLLRRCHSVIALPGRPLDSHAITETANRLGVPTLEIQAGTLTKLRKYIKPASAEVLAIDDFSKSVFCEFLGKSSDAVIVTGGSKVEHDVAPFRSLSMASARSRFPDLADITNAKWVVHAGQPVGLGVVREMIAVLMNGLRDHHDTYLVIRPHPSETEDYLRMYHELAAELNFDRWRIASEGKTLEAVVSADIVTTYFSTVGLEAYTLNRPVFVINPFAGRPPFDLIELGVAAEAKTAAEFSDLFEKLIGLKSTTFNSEGNLWTLRDGKAIERIQNIILARARLHRDRTNLFHPAFYIRKARSLVRRLTSR